MNYIDTSCLDIRNSLSGMSELLFCSRHLPDLVIQIFVAFADGLTFAICTCTGSNGLFSLIQIIPSMAEIPGRYPKSRCQFS